MENLEKMSLDGLKKLSRKEMKSVMAGTSGGGSRGYSFGDCNLDVCCMCRKHFWDWYCSMVYYGC